jgi:hypothetical protein
VAEQLVASQEGPSSMEHTLNSVKPVMLDIPESYSAAYIPGTRESDINMLPDHV